MLEERGRGVTEEGDMEENGMLWQGREGMGWERDMAVCVCVVCLWKGQWMGRLTHEFEGNQAPKKKMADEVVAVQGKRMCQCD